MMATDSALVRLDRLCRTLHALNYCGHAAPDLTLFLRVEPRLLSIVKQNHGQVFGEVLGHCGIATSRVVIEIPIEAGVDSELTKRVVINYRKMGYRVALNYRAHDDAAIWKDIRPDLLRVDSQWLHAEQSVGEIIVRVHDWGGRVLVAKIETARELVVAMRAGADLLQGFLVGAPDFGTTGRHRLNPIPQTITATGILSQTGRNNVSSF